MIYQALVGLCRPLWSISSPIPGLGAGLRCGRGPRASYAVSVACLTAWLALVCLATVGTAQANTEHLTARWEFIDRVENSFGFFNPVVTRQYVWWEVSPSYAGSPWMVRRLVWRGIGIYPRMECGLMYGAPQGRCGLFVRKLPGQTIRKAGWLYRVHIDKDDRNRVHQWEFAPGQEIEWIIQD